MSSTNDPQTWQPAAMVPPTWRRSAALFDRARRVLVDGVASPSRGTLNYRPHPIFMLRGSGGEIVDVDGNSYVDLMLAYGALPHGHAHPRLVAALARAAESGALFATAHEIEIEVAERLREMVPGIELVRFANTGTEACMAAARILRGYTGKPKLLKFEGHYHGWSETFSFGSNPGALQALDTKGVPAELLSQTISIPWNDLDAVRDALERHGDEIAAIVTEPVMANMGVIPPEPGFLLGLRKLADQHGVLLYLDETVTGFRVAPGGAQERFGVRADLVTFGKALGAGFPTAAIAGRADLMEVLSEGRVLHYGTQNANPALLAVVHESLAMLGAPVFERLERLAATLVAELRSAIAAAGVPALVQHVGPMMQVFFLRPGSEHVQAIRSARDFEAHVDPERFQSFAHALLERGIYLSPSPALHSVLCTAHTEEQLDRVVDAASSVLGNA